MRKRLSNKHQELKSLLNQLLNQYADRKFLQQDPVYYLHQFQDPLDQEVVGLLSALLAFGNVKAIQGSVGRLLQHLGPHPARYIRNFQPEKEAIWFQKQGHRWVRGGDLILLLTILRDILIQFGTLKNFFLKHYRETDRDIGPILERVAAEAKDFAALHHGSRDFTRGFRYFFPSPVDKSPCKRLCLYLRWMVRSRDGIDLGLWSEIPSSKLVIPLDLHIFNFSQKYRLSPYKTARWETALQVTEFLKELDSSDPVKYDFPLCHYGMEVGW